MYTSIGGEAWTLVKDAYQGLQRALECYCHAHGGFSRALGFPLKRSEMKRNKKRSWHAYIHDVVIACIVYECVICMCMCYVYDMWLLGCIFGEFSS